MGFFGLFNRPPNFDKMVEENDIGGLIDLIEKGYNGRCQEDIDRAKQAIVIIKTRLNTENNAWYLVNKILNNIGNTTYYLEALTVMGKDSYLVEPLIARLMAYYYLGGSNVRFPESIDFRKLRFAIRDDVWILTRLNDKRTLKPILLAMADRTFSSFSNEGMLIAGLEKYGDESKLKLREVIAAPDPTIYLNTLIEDLFQSYDVIRQIKPEDQYDWNKRVDNVNALIREDDTLYMSIYMENFSGSPYTTDKEIFRASHDAFLARIELNRKDRVHYPGARLRHTAEIFLKKI